MFLKLIYLLFIGAAWTLENKKFAYVGGTFCLNFNTEMVPTGNSCSVTKDNTKAILFYGSNDQNVTIGPDFSDRLVNIIVDVSLSIQFCIQSLTQTDNGTYTNNCSSSSSGITLAVIYPISDVKIEQIDPIPAIAGLNYSLYCNVVPHSAYITNISWWFSNNSTQILEDDNFKFHGDTDELFEIRDVKQSFAHAQFVCHATSILDQTMNSQKYSLNIVVRPEIQLIGKTINAVIGRPFFTECRATGSPSLRVQWTENNTVVPQIQKTNSSSVLVIQNVTFYSHVIYTCWANVSYGRLILQANESVTIRPYGPPNPPKEVSVTVLSSQSAEMHWVSGEGRSQRFVSAYHILNREVFHYNSPESVINGRYYQKLGDLEGGTDYEAFIFARNDAGDSKKVFFKFKTPEQQFFDSIAYNYTIFGFSIFAVFSLLVLLTLTISRTVKRSHRICLEKLPETLEMDRVLEKRKKSERDAENTEVKQEKCSKEPPDDNCSEPSDKPQPITTSGDPQAQSLYEDIITEDVAIKNIPKMPTKLTKASHIKKIHSEPVISKNKKSSDVMIVTKRRDPPPEPKDAPIEYSSLRTKSVGPALYEEMTIDRPDGGKATVIIKDSEVYANTILSEEQDERL